MRILFALPGLHRVHRGAEVALESVAQELALTGQHEVTLIGSGNHDPGRAYRFIHVPAAFRTTFEKWPKLPFLRTEFMYEDMTFAAGLLAARWRAHADITVTCNYPYTNWALRSHVVGSRWSAHVFVTQNGDWPAYERRRESRFFSCDGLVCTNPLYYERNRDRWFSALIPNGIDPTRFRVGRGDRTRLGLPHDRPVILMVSALAEGKRVMEGMRAVARVPDAFFFVAGDGPLRDAVDTLGNELLPGRFRRMSVPHEMMPTLYRSADIFLHCCIRESFGNVYIEALSCGTPVVAHDDEVTRWIFAGHARLVDTMNEPALVAALTGVLHAPSAAREGAAFAADTYGWHAVAERYREFFADVMRRRGLVDRTAGAGNGRRDVN